MTLTAGVATIALCLAGCAGVTASAGSGASAAAAVKNAGGQTVGAAAFTEVSGGVRVVLEVHDLPPGEHAVHVHAVGKCEPPQFLSAGGHFNPTDKEHGMLNPEGPHAGDLPNVTVGANGTGRLESFTDRLTLSDGPTSVFEGDGSALVIHADPDDFKTDPAGNSGARIACGVIVRR